MDARQLLDKLPQVRAWIDQTLALHKPKARSLGSYGFTRLPQVYSAGVLLKAMPKMLGDGGQKSATEKMREILERMSARTLEQDRCRLMELLSGL